MIINKVNEIALVGQKVQDRMIFLSLASVYTVGSHFVTCNHL